MIECSKVVIRRTCQLHHSQGEDWAVRLYLITVLGVHQLLALANAEAPLRHAGKFISSYYALYM